MQNCKLDMVVYVFPTPAHYGSALVVDAMRWAGSGGGAAPVEFDANLNGWADYCTGMLTHPASRLGETPVGPAVANMEDGRLAVFQVADVAAWQATGGEL